MKNASFDWIVGSDTGVSSKTIWGVMMGAEVYSPSIPWDTDDFGRCYRLLQMIPEWRHRLTDVSEKYPEWKPLVDSWDELTRIFEAAKYEHHNNPEHGERLMKQFPPVYGTKWDRGIDVDLRPPGRPEIALCIAFCLALQSIGQEEPT